MRFAIVLLLLLSTASTAGADPECASPVSCRPKCKAGDTAACTWLGLYYTDSEHDDDRRHAGPLSSKLLEASCKADDQEACVGFVARFRYSSNPTELKVAARFQERACKAGYGAGCTGDVAVAIWEKQCAAGSVTACFDGGTAYEPRPAHSTITIYASAPDPTKAAALTKRGRELAAAACAGGNARRCFPGNNLNVVLKIGKDAAILEKACTLGNVYGCGYAAALVGSKQAKAFTGYLEKGCAAGASGQCMDLSTLHSEGRLGTKDLAAATKYLQLACDHGRAEACVKGAKTFLRGVPGLAKDPKKGVAFYQRGCDNEDAVACAGLGDAYLEGTGVAKSLDKGLAAWERGCTLMTDADVEELNVCNELSIKYRLGDADTGVKANAARAEAVRTEACGRGVRALCKP